MVKFSFVIPVYNSEKTIRDVVSSLIETIKAMEIDCDYEIILIDDGSAEPVYDICVGLSRSFPQVRPFRLSKNFGQANALMAGLNQVTGDYIICLDDDLQTPPEEFPKLYKHMLEGNYDLVYGYYPQKKDSLFRKFGTRMNSFMQSIVLGKSAAVHTSSYFISRRYIVDVVKNYDRPFPYLPGLFLQVSRNVSCVPIRHEARKEGKSGYSFQKLLNLWLDGYTNFSILPLRLATILGFFIALIAFIFGVVLIILKLCQADIQEGWTSTITIVLFIGGIQLFSLGFLGEYVGRIYLSINRTPQYVILKKPEDISPEINNEKSSQ